MVSFLIISFIIHLFTIFIIIILYQRISLFEQQDSEEIEQLFQKYLAEIKAENKQLQQQLQQPIKEPSKNPFTEPYEHAPLSEIDQEIEDDVETSQTAKILSLTKKGYTPNEIAQELKCGKTEVELIIKFYKENNHKA